MVRGLRIKGGESGGCFGNRYGEKRILCPRLNHQIQGFFQPSFPERKADNLQRVTSAPGPDAHLSMPVVVVGEFGR